MIYRWMRHWLWISFWKYWWIGLVIAGRLLWLVCDEGQKNAILGVTHYPAAGHLQMLTEGEDPNWPRQCSFDDTTMWARHMKTLSVASLNMVDTSCHVWLETRAPSGLQNDMNASSNSLRTIFWRQRWRILWKVSTRSKILTVTQWCQVTHIVIGKPAYISMERGYSLKNYHFVGF